MRFPGFDSHAGKSVIAECVGCSRRDALRNCAAARKTKAVSWLRILYVIGILAATAGAVDREAFTFTKYDLQVRLEPTEHRLAVRGKISVRNDSAAPQKNLVLQISSSLDWHSITLSDKPVEFLTQPYASDIDHTGAAQCIGRS
jgi:hypothetical protein